MKKAFAFAYPLFLFPIVFLFYQPVNQLIILKWLGSGDPVIGSSGITKTEYFSANDFSKIFLAVIAILAIFLSLFNLKRIQRKFLKAAYLMCVVLYNIFCYHGLILYTIWK